MEPFRLHFKVGEHVFDAEGPQEAVERQLAVWREMIAALPSPPPRQPQTGAVAPPGEAGASAPPETFADYDKVFRHDGKVVSLTVLPTGSEREADAALLVMLGRK